MKLFLMLVLFVSGLVFADADTVKIETIKTQVDTVEMEYTIGEVTDSTIVIKITPKVEKPAVKKVEKKKAEPKKKAKAKKKKADKKEAKK